MKFLIFRKKYFGQLIEIIHQITEKESKCKLQPYPEFRSKKRILSIVKIQHWAAFFLYSLHVSKSLQSFSVLHTLSWLRRVCPSAAAFSISWLNSPSASVPLPISTRMLAILLFIAFLISFLASLLLFLPPHLLSPSWICFTLHCSRPIARIQAEWVTHLQSAALKPCRRQSHPQTLLLSPGSHGCPSTGVHILSLHTFPEPRDDTGKKYTHSVTC